jgi:hypothetical protein
MGRWRDTGPPRECILCIVSHSKTKKREERRATFKSYFRTEKEREREKGYFVFVGTLSLQLSFVSFFTISFKRLGPFWNCRASANPGRDRAISTVENAPPFSSCQFQVDGVGVGETSYLVGTRLTTHALFEWCGNNENWKLFLSFSTVCRRRRMSNSGQSAPISPLSLLSLSLPSTRRFRVATGDWNCWNLWGDAREDNWLVWLQTLRERPPSKIPEFRWKTRASEFHGRV